MLKNLYMLAVFFVLFGDTVTYDPHTDKVVTVTKILGTYRTREEAQKDMEGFVQHTQGFNFRIVEKTD